MRPNLTSSEEKSQKRKKRLCALDFDWPGVIKEQTYPKGESKCKRLPEMGVKASSDVLTMVAMKATKERMQTRAERASPETLFDAALWTLSLHL